MRSAPPAAQDDGARREVPSIDLGFVRRRRLHRFRTGGRGSGLHRDRCLLQLREQALLLALELLHMLALSAHALALRHAVHHSGQRRLGVPVGVRIAAAVQIGLRQHVRLLRAADGLAVHQDDFELRCDLFLEPLGKSKSHRQNDDVNQDGNSKRDREHAVMPRHRFNGEETALRKNSPGFSQTLKIRSASAC